MGLLKVDGLGRRGKAKRHCRRQACGDQRAVSGEHTPVAPSRGGIIGEIIGYRELLEASTADVTADRLEIGIPGPTRFQRVAGAVALRRNADQAFVPSGVCFIGFILIRFRKAEVSILLTPCRLATIDGKAGCFRDVGPWIAVGRMKPATAEIKRMPGYVDRERTAAHPLRGFQKQRGMPAFCEPARSPDTRGATSD